MFENDSPFLEPLENVHITIRPKENRIVSYDTEEMSELIKNIQSNKADAMINCKEFIKKHVKVEREVIPIYPHDKNNVSEINANYTQTKYKLLTYVNKITNHEYVDKFINLYPSFSELETKRQKRIISRAYTEWVCCNKETNSKPIDKINYLDKI